MEERVEFRRKAFATTSQKATNQATIESVEEEEKSRMELLDDDIEMPPISPFKDQRESLSQGKGGGFELHELSQIDEVSRSDISGDYAAHSK